MIKNVMKCALICMGLVFSVQCMEERENGSKSANSSVIKVNNDILKQFDSAIRGNDSDKALALMQRLFTFAGLNYNTANNFEKCRVFVALLKQNSKIDVVNSKTCDYLSKQLMRSYCALEEHEADRIKIELTPLIDSLIAINATQTLSNLIALFAPNKVKKEEPSREYQRINKVLERDMVLRGDIPSEIQRAIAEAKENDCIKNLLELRKQDGQYEQLIDQAIVSDIGELYPIPTLKEKCVKKLKSIFKGRKFETFEPILKELPDDLRKLFPTREEYDLKLLAISFKRLLAQKQDELVLRELTDLPENVKESLLKRPIDKKKNTLSEYIRHFKFFTRIDDPFNPFYGTPNFTGWGLVLWDPLYQALYEGDVEGFSSTIKHLKSDTTSGMSCIQDCYDYAIGFSKNWNIILLLKNTLSISEKELLNKAIKAGNIFLVQKCILEGFTLDIDPSSIVINKNTNARIVSLLKNAGLDVKFADTGL